MMPMCPFCGEPGQRGTRHKGIYRCGRHGAFEWFARELLNDTDIIGIYQSYPYNRGVFQDFEQMEPAYVRGLRHRILKYYPRTEGLSFLDVGCANGEYLRAAQALKMKPLAGIEVDEEAKSRAAPYGPISSNLDDLREQYDVVQCKNVLTNILDFQGFFQKLLEKTKPGGVLFLDVLNQFGLVAQVKKAVGKPGILRPPFVVNGFSKKALAELARRNSARLIWMKTTYVGSDLLPYRRNFRLLIRGRLGQLLAAGSMIAADITVGTP